MQTATTVAEPSNALAPKHQCYWEQSGEVWLKSKSVALNLQAQIA